MIGRTGLLQRKAVALSGAFVQVQETWDPTAADCPMCALPRGALLPNPFMRAVVMSRAEAEALGLLPRTN
jgi:hypothetical protein